MKHYYLHLSDIREYIPDEEGSDFGDLAAAQTSAIESIRSILSDDVSRGLFDLRGRIDIGDASGQVLSSVHFAEAVQVHMNDGGHGVSA